MRINVYAEELTSRVERIEKKVNGRTFVGYRLYLELPVTTPTGGQISGPFIHAGADDDDSSAITFWSRERLRSALQALQKLIEETP